MRDWFHLRRPAKPVEAVVLGAVCICLVFGAWWFVTRGEHGEDRIVTPGILPSPAETFSQFPELWKEFELTQNTLYTLRRVSLGFLLAVLVGVPLGIAAGCFPRFGAFIAPVVIFGRNIPLAAV